jgi:hypothetical protein
MIDTTTEILIPFGQAPRHYPGYRPHISTCHRHRLRGVGGIRLETVRIGGRRFTSVEAIRRFVERVNGESTSPANSTGDSATFDETEQQLDSYGF